MSNEGTKLQLRPKLPPWGWVNRVNRVPAYQKMFQEGQKDHTRQWLQTRRGVVMFRSYQAVLIFTTAGAMWMMGRQVFGHKTWWGK